MKLKKIGKVFTSKFVETGPPPYKKRIYRAAVSQRLRDIALDYCITSLFFIHPDEATILEYMQKLCVVLRQQWTSVTLKEAVRRLK